MPGTPIQELKRILALSYERGARTAWLSDENKKAFFNGVATALRGGFSSAVPSAGSPQRQTEQAHPQSFTAQKPAPSPVPPPSPAPSLREAMARQATPPQTIPQSATQQSNDGDYVQTISPDAVAGMEWPQLVEAISGCHGCRLCQTRQHIVIEDGCRKARIMFIGEGPGEEEDKQGVPFVGRAGQMLPNMIKAMPLDRNSQEPSNGVYIANIVKCRPPSNRNPEQDEAAACISFLHRQIELVQPEVIVLLGAVPLLHLLNLKGITRLRGQWQSYRGIPVMPTFHPAYLLRFERDKMRFIEEKRKVWSDLQAVMRLLA